jgi:uncharacterized membrane protein
MAGLRRYLVAGVLVWLPILATVWVLGFIVDLTDNFLLLLPPSWQPVQVFGFRVPGLGIVFALVVLLLTGLAVTNLIGRRLVRYWDGLLKRIPLVRSIHGGVKGFAESVLSSSGNSFKQVVMVEYPSAGFWSIGFVTAESLGSVRIPSGEPVVCVYLPTTPNPTSGFIVLVARDKVVPVDMSVDAAMKMIVTLGVVAPPPAAVAAPGPPR